MKRWIRDWWRGWSELDLARAIVKVEFHNRPGEIIPVTERELRALKARSRNRLGLYGIDARVLRR
jgi:hypothetical protein